MTNSFSSLIESAKSLLVLLPVNPTLDEVAAGLSLYLDFSGKKKCFVSCPTPMTVEFNRLIGVNKVKKDFGDKNLVLRFVGYKADNIEKVSYDVENDEFQLTVVPKVGLPSPAKEQVSLSYVGASAELVILIGGNRKELFPDLLTPDLKNAKLAHIGRIDLGFANLVSFARPATSVSEIVASLIEESGFEGITADVATNLLAGIEDESKNFTRSGVTADTFGIVAALMRKGGRREMGEKIDRNTFPQGSIPGEMPMKEASFTDEPPLPIEETPIEAVEMESIPQEWLENPPIYKGTSTS